MTIREIKIVNEIVIIIIVLLMIVLQCNNPIIVSPYWLLFSRFSLMYKIAKLIPI